MSANSCPLSSDNTAAPGTETLCWSVGDFANLQIAISGMAGGVTYDVVANPGGVVLETIVADGLYAYNVVPYNRVCLVINVSGTGNSSVDAYLYNPVLSSSNGCSLSFDNTIIPPSTVNCWDTQNKNTLTLTFSGIAGGAEFEVQGSPGGIVIDTVTVDGDYMYDVTPYASVCVVLTVAGTGTTIIDGYTYVILGSGISHASLLDLGPPADDHPQYLHLPGRAGGQVAHGGVAAGEILTLKGADNAPDVGIIQADSPIVITYDTFANTTPIEQFAIRWAPTVSITASYIGGALQVATVWNVATGVFIPATFSDVSQVNVGATPGFSAFTFINELAVIRNDGNFNLPGALVMNIGLTHERNTAGTSTTSGTTGVSFSPQTRATIAAAIMTKTDQTAVRCSPTFSTVAGSTVNLGNIRGLHFFNPSVALFQPAAGAEAATSLIAVDVNVLPFGGNILKVALRSAIAAASNARFIQNIGTAESDFGASHVHWNDNAFIKMGGTVAAPDIVQFWASAENKLSFSTAFGVAGNPLYLHGTAADEWIFSHHSNNTLDIGMGFNVNAVVFGTTLPTPNSNNWFVQFAAPNQRQVQIGGEYSDVLWTAGGSIDVNGLAVSNLQAFKINSPAVILNGGTISDISNLFVEAMPSFGATRTQALRVLGRARIDGHMNSGGRQPAQITANQNDYSLGANNGQRALNLLDSDDDYNITGIDSSFGFAQTGDRVCLYNEGSFDLTLTHQDAASLAANRIITPSGLPHVIHPDECVWLWYDDTGTVRWRVLEGSAHQLFTRTLHLSGDQFRKGATAPTDVTIGTTPTVSALLFDATNELASLYHSHPVDIDLTKDVILRIQFSLAAVEVNLDTCDFTCDYTAPTLAGAAGVAKASTQVTGQFTAVTGRLAIGDIYEMDITFVAGDATNPLASSIGIAFEIHLTNTTGVGAIHLLDGDFIYEARY